MTWKDKTVAMIGAGSWGTALAHHLGGKGVLTCLWVFEPELLAILQDRRENPVFLPGIKLSRRISFAGDLAEAVQDQPIVIMAVPSHVYRHTLTQLSPHLLPGVILVSATKGIEGDTLLTMEGLVREIMGPETAYAVLSGPSFATEVARRQPTAVTVASRQRPIATRIQQLFSSPNLRVYASYDVTGVELGGALKNVMALGAGILEGLGLGANPRAALITRGLAEISRLGVRLGANPMTLAGLAGLGDLVLTCTSCQSRNYQVGLQLGQGKKLDDILRDMQMVAEGVKTARAAYHLAQKLSIDMPIVEQVYRILYEDHSPLEAIQKLMSRELKDEIDAMSQTW
ncbi:MAG: NAD(P)-dependent glycerol-3-phosphate dehydrogenase [Deltaproteobacteria bacterium]|nr:NAD(P)-dependent glycerol-3-phosphate dehydrogenase [Deltaproteobacteria bacterium]MBW1953387.1 NAD(P)-dependent glycerol-3-phosphate dehydrogenase [Deltaproteobacteria bacterium]MBW1986061.1 NAD(P)-dependent glycerol-3-phosphate dehydrogenase [Deltaproteobacteria bacterium]MBW2133934.1 NAD(P)-dependent glycerol-3-phosphate dehydrogenase [Deltaproteobacteria bacterium]